MHSNEVAKLAGVTVRTLRHYHQLGLLSEPPRRANGYRDYSPADVARVLRIKRLAGLGFPLSRIGDVLDEMDVEGNATSASALDELDRELALEIASVCKSSGAPSPSCARSTSTPTCPCASPASCACSPAWTPSSKRSELPTAPLSSSPGTCTTTKALGELERVVDTHFKREARGSHGTSSIAEARTPSRPMPPSRSGRPSPRSPSRHSSPSSPASMPPTGCGPATDRERFLDEIAFAGYNEAQQDVYGRIERGIEADHGRAGATGEGGCGLSTSRPRAV